MKKIIRLAVAILLLGTCINVQAQHMKMEAKSSKSEDLRIAMHKLWEDHVVWTRNVIFNIMDNLPGTNQAVGRLLQNQEDIGNAIKPYYGAAAGTELTRLLKEHITIAATLLQVAKEGNNANFEAANNKWLANADEIAAFLSKANAAWKPDDMKKMMRDHLALTTEEAVARLKKDYAADVLAYDKVHDEILAMADMLAAGIVTQFPQKFK